MDKGTYKGRRVVFKRYATSCFNPYLFCDPGSDLRGCGACALALLTGVTPEKIAAKNGGVHYPDAFMIRFLRKCAKQTIKFAGITNLKPGEGNSGYGLQKPTKNKPSITMAP